MPMIRDKRQFGRAQSLAASLSLLNYAGLPQRLAAGPWSKFSKPFLGKGWLRFDASRVPKCEGPGASAVLEMVTHNGRPQKKNASSMSRMSTTTTSRKKSRDWWNWSTM
jgi:hypothetical protein